MPFLTPSGSQRKPSWRISDEEKPYFIGLSKHHFNHLRFIISLDTTEITTGAAEDSLMCCDCLKRSLLKW